jgi:hypothetical protein
MKLDRSDGGRGKYAVVRLRRMDEPGAPMDAKEALDVLLRGGFVTMDRPGGDDEFFVIMLKDRYAEAALLAYAAVASADDPEYAGEVRALAARSGPNHPHCKKPD